VSTLGRRIVALEASAWERRKLRILRAAFAGVARGRGWTPDELARAVQSSLNEFDRLEPTVMAMCRQGKPLHEVLAWLAAETGLDLDGPLAEVGGSSLTGGDGRG
jgi:hypothetical protein